MKFFSINSLASTSDVSTVFGNVSGQKLSYIKILMDTIYGYGVQTVFHQSILDARQISYILATTQLETDNFKSLYEYGDITYFKQYDGKLGNRVGTEDYYTYRGRGFVHLRTCSRSI